MNTKLFAVFVAFAFAIAPVFAATGNSMNALCQAKGFDYGIAKWQYRQEQWVLGDHIEGYETFVGGSMARAEYTSSPNAVAVLTNGGAQVFEGGDGRLVKGENHNGNIEQIVFCADAEEVPEMSTFVLGGAAAIAVGLVAFRRK